MLFSSKSFICSPSSSYYYNYKMQFQIFDYFDKYTEENHPSKMMGLSVCAASNIITLMTRIAAVVEVFFGGLNILFSIPFQNERIHNLKSGLYEVFLHTSKNILRTCFTIIEFIDGVIFNFIEPKHYLMEIKECMRVNLLHAERGTINSSEHKKELNYVEGQVKPKFMKYQSRSWKRLNLEGYQQKTSR